METRSYKVYKFDELSETGKEKALKNLWDINIDFSFWHEHITGKDGDAEIVGLSIEEWDLGRGSYVHGTLIMSPKESINAILKNHGESCETYKFAMEQKKIFDKIKDEESEEYMFALEQYESGLCDEYLNILRKDYEYCISEEAIIETIKANDYDFTEDGKID